MAIRVTGPGVVPDARLLPDFSDPRRTFNGATCLADGHNHRVVGVIELIEVLDEFSAAFAMQAPRRLLNVFDDEQVCFVASEEPVPADAHVRADVRPFT